MKSLSLRLKIGMLIAIIGISSVMAVWFVFRWNEEKNQEFYINDLTHQLVYHIQKTVFFARNIAAGRRSDITYLNDEIRNVENGIEILKKGGRYFTSSNGEFDIQGQEDQLHLEFIEFSLQWKSFKDHLLQFSEKPSLLDSNFVYYQNKDYLTPEEIQILNQNKLSFDFFEENSTPIIEKTEEKSDASSLSLDDLFGDVDPILSDTDPLTSDDDPFALLGSDLFDEDPFSAGKADSKKSTSSSSLGKLDRVIKEDEYVTINRYIKINNPALDPHKQAITQNVDKLVLLAITISDTYQIFSTSKQFRFKAGIIITVSFSIFLLFFLLVYVQTQAIEPYRKLRKILLNLSSGNLQIKNMDVQSEHPEIINVFQSARQLAIGLQNVSQFADAIGKGKFDTSIEVRSNRDTLSLALVQMRANLMHNSEEDRRRNWANEGMAIFTEILRNSDSLEDLSYHIVSQLVQYINGNQGAIYVLKEEADKKYFELSAAYAYNKRKFLQVQIDFGQGLVGQACIEEDSIYLEEVPDSYVSISSGLGEARPRSILIVPLMVNELVYGVIEIASFQKLEKYQIAFVERLSESIAATIFSVQSTEKTKKLLDESQVFSDQMKAQEEEMRQTLESMAMEQEAMYSKQSQLQEKEQVLFEILDSTTSFAMSLDTDFNILFINKAYIAMLRKLQGVNVQNGTNLRDVLNAQQSQFWMPYYLRALKGERYSIIKGFKDIEYQDIYYRIEFSPIYSKEDIIKGFSILIHEVTQMVPIRWDDDPYAAPF